MRVRAGLTTLATVVLVAAVGCTSAGERGARPSAAATATTTHHATASILATDASPREVRARFEQLLGQHALLAVRQARSEVAMAPELKKVVDASLAANAGALQQLVTVTYDGAQAAEFEQLWKGYTEELAAYAQASATGSSTGVQEARAALLAHCEDWGAFLDDASAGRARRPGDQERQARVEQLMPQSTPTPTGTTARPTSWSARPTRAPTGPGRPWPRPA